MFALWRNLPSRPARSWPLTASLRHFTSSPPHHARFNYRDSTAEAYEEWKQNEGKEYKHSRVPCNWLGKQVPFPQNPSFKPPTPVSDHLRTIIWEQFMLNPTENNVRHLAGRYGISMKRVDAILRLKGLERQWIKVLSLKIVLQTPLTNPKCRIISLGVQTGFVKGMEFILGVNVDHQTSPHVSESSLLSEDTLKVDADVDASNFVARQRYERSFWEPVVESNQPILPGLLKTARLAAQEHTRQAKAQLSDPQLLGIVMDDTQSDVERSKVLSNIVARNSRPSLKFVDVGGKFLDVEDRKRRLRASERRSKLRARRSERRL